jgi:LysM repeat protein
VSRGETLLTIAKRYGTTVALIKQWNSLRGNVIHVGRRPVIERLSALVTNLLTRNSQIPTPNFRVHRA